ncbi:MAG: hypothetical protein H7X86_07220 [Gorillibacterium sp.]|nr:hypothetical protein [Gorillibacterium sp.]
MAKFLKYGLVSGILVAILNTGILLAYLSATGESIIWAGPNSDTLYPLVLFAVSLFASIIGALVVGLLFTRQKNGLRNYAILVILLGVLNSISSQTILAEQYRIIAHIVHLTVVLVSIWVMAKAGLRNRHHDSHPSPKFNKPRSS